MAEATPDGIADGYASELRREIMRSEIQRMQVLAVILTGLLTVTLAAINFVPNLVQQMFRASLEWWTPLVGIGPFALYEVVALFVLRRRAAQDKDFPRIARFTNALIETSLPSVIIFELSRHMDAAAVFGFWPPLIYFVFILLSTLRLDFWLSVWTGTETCWPNRLVTRSRAAAAPTAVSNCRRRLPATIPATTPVPSSTMLRLI
jgi:adenylate cyclase